MYRVDDLAQFVGEKMTCVVTEANPEKRNLVLSRRDAIERDRAEAKTRLMSELAEGQVREGVVRSLRDYGAFVDLGGVDGLLHVSQLAWQRVKHPSEVLQLGQTINVKIKKIDAETGKISLALRDLTENPWTTAAQRYPVTSAVTGTVTKIMDFGAFVELEPGIEGLVHISELAHGRVWRAGDVVKEGQQVEAKVLSVDVEQQRIGLSMKALMARAEPAKKPEPEVEEPAPVSPSPKRQAPLKGGTGRASGGDQFGLKW
jgi:small subunit ribosomal protein S1